ncbi:MAG TPA: alpha-L-fucosidase [Clostridia bacterium]|nr:alpha-L-fucosidase [Clostridia bacterium]
MKHPTLLASLILSLLAPLQPALAIEPETPAERDQRMEWFREARFGMFIHWGLYAVPAGEWNGQKNYGEWIMEEAKIPVSQYEQFAPQFNPVKFNARDWVRMAKDAGMKYIVITSKHHDGFALFPSTLTDWTIARTPFKRDPLKELAAACKKEGITFCFYHSIMDWHHPDWGTRRAWNDIATGTPDMERYIPFMKGQLKELLTNYGPIGILWFDGEWESPWTHERGVDLYNYVRSLQPKIIINNRVGKGRAGMNGMDKDKGVGDYGTPEQEIPATGFGPGVDWESCMTMNNHWGYNKNDQNWKSSSTLIRNLIDCASKGGNYLLNVGPTAEGLFPQASIERLADMGAWMKVNAEAIYDTTASPFKRLAWGRCTTKNSGNTTTLYLHVFNWPANGKLDVPGLKTQPTKAYLLAKPRKALQANLGPDGLSVSVPQEAPDSVSSTVVLKFKDPLEIVQPTLTQDASGSVLLPAIEARLHGDHIQYESGGQRDNIGFWTDPADWVDWEFTVNKPGKFEAIIEAATLGDTSLEIAVAGQKSNGRISATGDYGTFKNTSLGTLQVPGGKTTLSLRAVANGWQPVNVKAIRLKPL